MNDSPVPAVEVLSANKTYSNGTQALLPLDLRIEEGEFVTLLGPSGCGKSTLLKMVAGLLDPTDGRLLLWRKPVQQLAEVGKKMSFVFQSPTLMPWATVEKNVRLPLDLAAIDAQMANEKVREVLALVGLSKFAKSLPRALSGGMQMRVSIARGLVTDPDLLLMDEPFGALDAQTRTILQDELVEICAGTGATVLFITHDIAEAIILADRIGVMRAGPGSAIKDEFELELPRPRNRGSVEFAAIYDRIQRVLGEEVKKVVLREAEA